MPILSGSHLTKIHQKVKAFQLYFNRHEWGKHDMLGLVQTQGLKLFLKPMNGSLIVPSHKEPGTSWLHCIIYFYKSSQHFPKVRPFLFF